MLPSTYGRPPRGPVATRDQAVYLLSVPSGHHKIGRAKDPESRARGLQCGNPEKITLVGASQIDASGIDALEMERRVHALLRDYRAQGEWFHSPRQLIYAAWKYAWMSMTIPEVTRRYERLKSRMSAREVVTRDHDVLRPGVAPKQEIDQPLKAASTTYKHRDPEARRVYMRELMRKRRQNSKKG